MARHACSPVGRRTASVEVGTRSSARSSSKPRRTWPNGCTPRTPPPATRTFVGQPGHLRQPWGPGWALVGDAGSWKDPISAHGLTDALRDAELLGRAIIATSIDEQRDEDAYGTYERTRNRLTVPILTAADEIASFQWNDDRIAELLLELNAAMNDELDVITGFDHRQPIHPPAIAAQATH